MIEHLRGREQALESLGWTGREAEWIALVCLHSGVFTRAQFCFYFDSRRNRATRFVQALFDRGAAVEWSDPLSFNGRSKTCLISGKPIYRALGAEIIRHRRRGSTNVVMRRLLSLDFILEYPGMGWLPTEAEKVEFFEGLGVDRRLIPRRIYYGAVGAQKRYFALKLPVAVDRLYRRTRFTSERERVEHLFALYERLQAPLAAEAAVKRRSRRRARHSR